MAGEAIRTRREALQLTLEEVSAATRIPTEYIEALENDDFERLPAGPYAAAYARVLCEFLGVEDADLAAIPRVAPREPAPRETATEVTDGAVVVVQGPSLAWVQRLAVFSALVLFSLVLILLVQRTNRLTPAPRPEAGAPQTLRLDVRTGTRVTLVVDGERVIDDEWLAPRYTKTVTWTERAELDLQAIEDVVVTWNKRRVRPQGQQRASRRLVFVDDQRAGSPREGAEGR